MARGITSFFKSLLFWLPSAVWAFIIIACQTPKATLMSNLQSYLDWMPAADLPPFLKTPQTDSYVAIGATVVFAFYLAALFVAWRRKKRLQVEPIPKIPAWSRERREDRLREYKRLLKAVDEKLAKANNAAAEVHTHWPNGVLAFGAADYMRRIERLGPLFNEWLAEIEQTIADHPLNRDIGFEVRYHLRSRPDIETAIANYLAAASELTDPTEAVAVSQLRHEHSQLANAINQTAYWAHGFCENIRSKALAEAPDEAAFHVNPVELRSS